MADDIKDPLLQEIDEELRQDQYLKIWQKYGTFIVGGVVALVASVAGYQAWLSSDLETRSSQGQTFSRALGLIQSGKSAEAEKVFMDLAETGKPGYALLARLQEAGLRSERGDAAGAAALYTEIAGDTSVEEVFRDLATIRGTLAEMDKGDPQHLMDRLAPLIVANNPWRHSAQDISALLAHRSGNKDKALTLFKSLANDGSAPRGIRERAAEMIGVLSQ